MKKLAVILTILVLLLCCAHAEEQVTPYPELVVGSKSEEVITLKERLFELGYFESTKFTKSFTEDTAERLRAFQQLNGLTGWISGR